MMSFALWSVSRTPLPALALTFSWRETTRSWHIKHATGLIVAAALSLLAIWYLGATAYFVFHDQLVASLISHQADATYAYEDRIAVLQTQLDRETSRALIDRQTLATTIRDLASKSQLLEARSVTIDAMARGLNGAPSDASDAVAPIESLQRSPAKSGLSADVSAYTGTGTPAPDPTTSTIPQTGQPEAPHEDHAALSSDRQGQQLLATLSRVEARQTAGIAALRVPLLRKVERLQTALLDAGLSSSRWNEPANSGMGGPFVPLPESARTETFEQNLALLRVTLAEQARLADLVDIVPLRRPIDGTLVVTSPFGARVDPFLGQAAMHTGTDLMATQGAPVRATANGTVTVAGTEGGYGTMVEIDHGEGLATRYAHLSTVNVVVGQRVSAGAVVGRVGSTGRATGPHLHYETRVNGAPVDPARFLKAGTGLFPVEIGQRG